MIKYVSIYFDRVQKHSKISETELIALRSGTTRMPDREIYSGFVNFKKYAKYTEVSNKYTSLMPGVNSLLSKYGDSSVCTNSKINDILADISKNKLLFLLLFLTNMVAIN